MNKPLKPHNIWLLNSFIIQQGSLRSSGFACRSWHPGNQLKLLLISSPSSPSRITAVCLGCVSTEDKERAEEGKIQHNWGAVWLGLGCGSGQHRGADSGNVL